MLINVKEGKVKLMGNKDRYFIDIFYFFLINYYTSAPSILKNNLNLFLVCFTSLSNNEERLESYGNLSGWQELYCHTLFIIETNNFALETLHSDRLPSVLTVEASR